MPYDLTYLKPPEEGNISVLSLSADTASAAQDLLASNIAQTHMVTFVCNEVFYLTFSTDKASVTDPDITATSGDGRTWLCPANTPISFKIGVRNRYFKAISASACYLRWRIED